MKAPSRWTAARLAAVVLACALLAGCSGAALYSELEETQANEMMAALLSSGVQAEKLPSISKKGWEVRVPRGDIPYAMQVLNSRGLPHAQYTSMCEIFKKEGFASSATEEKARYICSLNQELSRTLSRIEGVIDARVHIALPERDPLAGQTQDSSASVMIFERPGAKLRDRETDIKVFVKDSVEGLDDVNKVSVKFFTVPAAPDGRQRSSATAVAMSAISPVGVAITIGALLLIGLGLAFGGRLRVWLAQIKAPPPPPTGVWKG